MTYRKFDQEEFLQELYDRLKYRFPDLEKSLKERPAGSNLGLQISLQLLIIIHR